MKSKWVFFDINGKYSTAVFYCTIKDVDPQLITDDWITRLFPVAHGKSTTPFGVTRHGDIVSWRHLITNDKQTTRADIRRRIDARLKKTDTPGLAEVHVEAGLPSRGQATRSGSPRSGTRRTLSNAPHTSGVTAR